MNTIGAIEYLTRNMQHSFDMARDVRRGMHVALPVTRPATRAVCRHEYRKDAVHMMTRVCGVRCASDAQCPILLSAHSCKGTRRASLRTPYASRAARVCAHHSALAPGSVFAGEAHPDALCRRVETAGWAGNRRTLSAVPVTAYLCLRSTAVLESLTLSAFLHNCLVVVCIVAFPHL